MSQPVSPGWGDTKGTNHMEGCYVYTNQTRDERAMSQNLRDTERRVGTLKRDHSIQVTQVRPESDHWVLDS